jgi:hypothetical protein
VPEELYEELRDEALSRLPRDQQARVVLGYCFSDSSPIHRRLLSYGDPADLTVSE